jgi:proteasome accessory factor C
MSESAEGRLGRRLRRILLLLPYAIQHPGVTVDDLSERFGVKKGDLLDDLNLVFMCGLPGYGPGDLIDVTIDDDRVYVGMADYFSAPLRLTPAEALALYAGGATLADLPEMEDADALRRALGKLGRALGVTEEDRTAGIEVKLEATPSRHLETLQRALSTGRRARLEYLSASRGALSERTIDPWGLVAALGHWYLVAFDHLSEEERMFRLDRIKAAELLDEPAEVPVDFDPRRYKGAFVGGGDQPTMTIEISPDVARWFEDYYPVVSAETMEDGWRRIVLITSGEVWAATLVLRLGAGVRSVSPREVSEAARSRAEAIAASYA